MGGKSKAVTRSKPKEGTPEAVLGAIIRERRLAKNVSQRDFAAQTELERSTIAYVELGTRSPSLPTLIEIARALDTVPSELLREMEDRIGLSSAGSD
jgi:transcriptional regulator with XRE-family HTH domain